MFTSLNFFDASRKLAILKEQVGSDGALSHIVKAMARGKGLGQKSF